MFDESAAVPAAPEHAAFLDDAQPLGPYSCTMEEAGAVGADDLSSAVRRTALLPAGALSGNRTLSMQRALLFNGLQAGSVCLWHRPAY